MACAVFPALISQRGLSGTRNEARKKISDGTATAVNIQRQPTCPTQDSRMASAVAPIDGPAIFRLMICAARMPMTMVSWLSVTRRPRHAAGLISAI